MNVALIPVRESDLQRADAKSELGGKGLLEYTIRAAKQARKIDRILISTDSEKVRQLGVRLGAEVPFLRPSELAAPGVSLDEVLRHAVCWLEEHGTPASVLVLLETSHPLRPVGLVDQVVDTLLSEDLDTVFAAVEEKASFWMINEYGELQRVGEEGEHETRKARRTLYKELGGLALATRTEVLKRGHRVGARVGLVPIHDLSALVDTQEETGLALLRQLTG